ncbi:MAG TPA: metallophosphoesterase [Methanosarcinales archaeon]|nr:metallophosphoesterase [Methanosarcinales archaeon]
MKIWSYSDTHGQHKFMDYPSPSDRIDTMIHSGDLTNGGSPTEIWSAINWFGDLVKDGIFKRVIFTPGNHDKFLQKADFRREVENNLPDGVIMLIDQSIVVEGLTFYGSPWTPEFNNYFFGYRRDLEVARACWAQCPDKVDILITHGPPLGILDEVLDQRASFVANEKVYRNIGCQGLLERVLDVKPYAHIFGHCHVGYGKWEQDGIRFFNSALLNTYHTVNSPPWQFEVIKVDDECITIY